MDLLTKGLIGFSALTIWETACLITNKLDGVTDRLKGIGLTNYYVPSFPYKTSCGKEVTIICKDGGNIEELQDSIGKLEKAFGGKILIENIPFSKKIKMNIITKELDGFTQPMTGDPLIIPVGFTPFGENISLDLRRSAGALINGVPGVGKSVLIKQINDYVTRNGAKCYYIQLAKGDLKGLGVNVADNVESIKALTEEILTLVKSLTNEEIIYVFIDEFSFLTPSKGDDEKQIKEQIIKDISDTLRICRSENVRIILSTQKVVAEFLPTSISSMLESKITFKCGDGTSSKMVIGTEEATKLVFREFILSDTEGIKLGKTYKLII